MEPRTAAADSVLFRNNAPNEHANHLRLTSEKGDIKSLNRQDKTPFRTTRRVKITSHYSFFFFNPRVSTLVSIRFQFRFGCNKA